MMNTRKLLGTDMVNAADAGRNDASAQIWRFPEGKHDKNIYSDASGKMPGWRSAIWLYCKFNQCAVKNNHRVSHPWNKRNAEAIA